MSTYVYTARRDRTPVQGTVVGETKAAAASELRRKGLTVLSMEEKKGLASLNELLEGTQRIKLRDKVVFSRQFATMIDAGLALLRGLFILEEQTSNPRFRKIITAVRQDVEAGMPLSDAVEKHPLAFDRLYVSMVRAGEVGGVLDQTLERLAIQLEKDDSLRRNIKSAMTYPILIGAFAILVMFGLILFVIPIFADMYNDLGGQLPLLTRIMMGISSFFRHFWFIVFPMFALALYGLKRLKESKRGTETWDRVKLHLPMKLGDIIQKIAVARFSRTLATLVSSGVPILQAIEITGKTSGNTVIEYAMEDVKENIKGGDSIARPLEKVSVFPPDGHADDLHRGGDRRAGHHAAQDRRLLRGRGGFRGQVPDVDHRADHDDLHRRHGGIDRGGHVPTDLQPLQAGQVARARGAAG